MKLNQVNSIHYFTFQSFDNTNITKHCFSTRLGGVSQGACQSMNFGFNRGEDRETVLENYRLLCGALEIDYKDIVYSSQIHEDKICQVSKNDRGHGILHKKGLEGYDGLMTNEKNVILTTFHADCVPLYFLDPVKKVIALSHSGWRGTVKEIGKTTVNEMAAVYGCNKEDILVGIGPSIGVCCFEVHDDVAKPFRESLPFSEKYISNSKTEKDKYNINLQSIIKESLTNGGILSDNIEISDLCTKCHPEYFYSHRSMGTERGSMVAMLMLK